MLRRRWKLVAGVSVTTVVVSFAIERYLKSRTKTLDVAVEECRKKLLKVQKKHRCPGLSVAVSINGETVWKEGVGLADVENKVPFSSQTKVKIASISKALTATALAKLWLIGQVDIDKPVTDYVPHWPEKNWQGEKVEITTRQLLSHMSGIRDYMKLTREEMQNATKKPEELQYKEYYIKEEFKNIKEALTLFKDDPLVVKPGIFHYSTHGYTLIGAVIESVTKKTFRDVMIDTFRQLGLVDTVFNDHNKVIYNRAGLYYLDGSKVLNAPYSSSSFRLAGAGVLSTVEDLLRFAHVLLYSYQSPVQAYLGPYTVREMWSPIEGSQCSWDAKGGYGLGFQVAKENGRLIAGHTGSTLGSSAVLLISPADEKIESILESEPTQGLDKPPRGIAVAILANLQGVELAPVAKEICKVFYKVKT